MSLSLRLDSDNPMWGRKSLKCEDVSKLILTNSPARVLGMLCRYGMKLDAVVLLQEWVRDVGGRAGLSESNARIGSGAVGLPESRLEVCPHMGPM
jgi:hypothetical protein